MKIIITIAGEGERWGNYKDVEKWRPYIEPNCWNV